MPSSHTFGPSAIKLDPLYPNDGARMRNVTLIPGTYAKGTVLGERTPQSEVQTLTFGGTPTGGTFLLSFRGRTTSAISWSATNATLQGNIDTALEALPTVGTGNVVVAVGTAVAGIGTFTVTFAGALANQAVPQIVVEANNMTGTAPTLTLAQTTAGVSVDTFAAYNDAAGDGTQTAKAILVYSCVADELGNVTIAGEFAAAQLGTPVYLGGGAVFRTQELTGLDANGMADLQASLIEGSLISGLLRF